MAKMKDALLDVLEQSADDEGLDTIEPSPEAVDLANQYGHLLAGELGHPGGPLSPVELRRFAVGIDRIFGEHV